MICSKNAQNLAKNARHSAHHNFTRKCPKCPIFRLFPASSPPKMPSFMPKQKTHIPFFAQNIVKFCIFWAGPDNFWKCPKKGPGPTMVFSASKPFKMPDMGRNAHFWSPCTHRERRYDGSKSSPPLQLWIWALFLSCDTVRHHFAWRTILWLENLATSTKGQKLVKNEQVC